MKRLLILSILFTMFLPGLFSQRFLGSVIAGMNLSKIDGDEVDGFYKAGANFGAALSLPLDEKQHWTVTLELLYTQKGSYKKYRAAGHFDTLVYAANMFTDVDRSVAFDPKMKCKINLDYVEIPIMVHYEDFRSGCSIGAGFSWGRLVRAKEIYNGFLRTTNVRSKTYSTSDWGVFADARIKLWRGLKLGIRYQYSLVPVRKMTYTTVKTNGATDSWNRKFYNTSISVRLMYIINEKFKKDEHGKWVKDTSSTSKK